jgi:deoxyribodipyrimidine photo-lyase
MLIFHPGSVSAARCALTVKKYSSSHKESVDAFLEESIIRRELADNFCFYQVRFSSGRSMSPTS